MNSESVAPLDRELNALTAAWSAALPRAGLDDSSPPEAAELVARMSDTGLLAVVQQLGRLRLQLCALSALTAAELRRRSRAAA